MSTSAQPTQPGSRTSGWSIVSAAFGGLLGLIALALIVAGAVLAFAYAFDRDDDGYFTSPVQRLQTDTPALTGEGLDLGDVEGATGEWLIDELDISARITATAEDGGPIFVGIAHQDDIDAYLRGVAHDEVDDIDGSRVTYRRTPGAPRAAPPGDETFWDASAEGAGRQTVTWEPSAGEWAAVVMRPDGSAGVAADVSVGGRTTAVLWIAVALIVVGLLFAVGAAVLIWLGVRSPRQPPAPAAPQPAAPPG